MPDKTLWRVYDRLSDNKDGKAANVKEQDFDNRTYAAEHRLTVVGTSIADSYVDDGISASDHSKARRDAFESLIADIEADTRAGKVSGILCTELTRLYRRPRELEEILDPADRSEIRVRIRTTDDGKEWDLRSATGRKELRDAVDAAAWYSDYVSEKAKRKAKHRAREGRRHGGKIGYGFDYVPAVRDNQGSIVEFEVVTINQAQAMVIRDMVARVLAGASIRSICADLNHRGITTRDGKRWHTGNMQRILRNPAIAGIRLHKDLPEPVRATWGFTDDDGDWGAIVKEKDWRRLQAILANPARRTNLVTTRTALLTGFVYCGYPDCGRKLTASRNQDGKRIYTCRKEPNRPGCGRIRRLADPVDQLVSELIISILEDSDFTIPLPDDDEFAALWAQKRELEQQQAQLAIDHYRLRLIRRVPYLAANEALEADIAAIQRKLDRASTHRHVKELPVGEVAQQEWDAHVDDLAWRRELVGLFIEKVLIKPSRHSPIPYDEHFRARFDPESIDVVPRNLTASQDHAAITE
jgi:site-specific DNA recombinase